MLIKISICIECKIDEAIVCQVFSDKHAIDKISTYKFGGDFNSSREEILTR